MCWTHEELPQFAEALGVNPAPPKWKDKDFRGAYIITYPEGAAALEHTTTEAEETVNRILREARMALPLVAGPRCTKGESRAWFVDRGLEAVPISTTAGCTKRMDLCGQTLTLSGLLSLLPAGSRSAP